MTEKTEQYHISTGLDATRSYQHPATPLYPMDIRIAADPNNDSRMKIKLELDMSRASSKQFVQNIKKAFRLKCGDTQAMLEGPFENNKLHGEVTVSREYIEQGNAHIDCKVNDRTVADLILQNEELCFKGKNPSHNRNALTISECRILSHPLTDMVKEAVPYPRRGEMSKFEHKQHSPITDLHTHLSAQLSPSDLYKVALAEDQKGEQVIGYPLDLLEEMGLKIPPTVPRSKVHGFAFNPAIDEGFAVTSEKQTDNIKEAGTHPGIRLKDLDTYFQQNKPAKDSFLASMAIPPNTIYSAADFDQFFYRFRNPLEKHPLLTKEKILQVAKTYKDQGIQYAELSTGSMFNPQWLAEVLPILEEVERDTGVQLRLLVGLPRSKTRPELEAMIDKMEVLSESPYIVGCDLLGFESNKTEAYEWIFEKIGQWPEHHIHAHEGDEPPVVKSNFSVRIHAGENSKNTQNVADAIKFAEQYNISLRVGHAIYGDLDDSLFAAAKRTGTIIEFIPDSNIGLDNIDFLHDHPMKKWSDAGVRSVLGSDGAGAYRTSSDMLAKSALHAGFEISDLEKMRHLETQFIAEQKEIFDAQKERFSQSYDNDSFVKNFTEKSQEIDGELRAQRSEPLQKSEKPMIEFPEKLKDRTPILLAGASGTSWKKIDANNRHEISYAAQAFMKYLDPEKVYFVFGRPKDAGFEKCFEHAIPKKHGQIPTFDHVSVATDDQCRTENPAWSLDTKGELVHLASEVSQFMSDHNGISFFAGGAALTRMFIQEARRRDLPHVCLEGPQGAANDKCRTAKDNNVIKGPDLATNMLMDIVDYLGDDVFKDGKAPTREEVQNFVQELRDREAEEMLFGPQPSTRTR